MVCLTSFTVFCLEILKKSFENDQLNGHLNDQLNGHFQSFFIYFFFVPPDPKSEKNSRKSTNKKNLALSCTDLYRPYSTHDFGTLQITLINDHGDVCKETLSFNLYVFMLLVC